MAIANGYAYIPNSSDNKLNASICPVNADGIFGNCTIFTGPDNEQPNTTGVRISGAYAYIIGLNPKNVIAT